MSDASMVKAPMPDRITPAFVAASASLLGLTIRDEWQAGVLMNLTAITAAADLLLAYPLEDTLEAASIFRA